MQYNLSRITVGSFQEFSDVIADYHNYHVSQCVAHGGFNVATEAAGRAKEVIEREYRTPGWKYNHGVQ